MLVDLLHLSRNIRRSPASAGAAILTLTLTLGTGASIFAVVDTLGVTPALGRGFHPDDVGQRVVIISHAFWRGKLAADPGVIGRQIVLGSQSYMIVGVYQNTAFGGARRDWAVRCRGA